uniref:Uncharacterized protein n=1 Tax=Ditylenchus dipsaci TaxID=166011 RepID=A0A915EGN2_9BILA
MSSELKCDHGILSTDDKINQTKQPTTKFVVSQQGFALTRASYEAFNLKLVQNQRKKTEKNNYSAELPACFTTHGFPSASTAQLRGTMEETCGELELRSRGDATAYARNRLNTHFLPSRWINKDHIEAWHVSRSPKNSFSSELPLQDCYQFLPVWLLNGEPH